MPRKKSDKLLDLLNVKQNKTRSQRIKERAEEKRLKLWPDIPIEKNWNRKGSNGFTTVPRILTLTSTIMDALSEKNHRISATYLGLWCRVWDTGVVVIENEYELATEVGFTGTRRVYTWRDRIKQLAALNFIAIKDGPKGPYQYILIINPYHALYDHYMAGHIQDHLWDAFIERIEEVGARDIEIYKKSLTENQT